jgi:hypothetical protein
MRRFGSNALLALLLVSVLIAALPRSAAARFASEVTISAVTAGYYQTAVPNVELRVYPLNNFLKEDGTPVVASTPGSGRFYSKVTCTVASNTISCPSITVPATESSPDNPSAKLGAYLYTTTGQPIGVFSVFDKFSVPDSPTTTTWGDIRLHNVGTLPTLATRDVGVSGDLTVNGMLDAESDTVVGGNLTVAGTISGNGAGISGLAGATGGVANTGSTSIMADTDNDGVGIIDLIVGGVTRLRAGSSGVDVFGTATGKFYDKGGEVYNARAFGAIGNGVTDDTTALRNWIAAACTSSGGVAYLPQGNYYVNPSSGTEVLLIQHPCILMGASNRRSVIVPGPSVPSTMDIIRVAPSTMLGTGPYDDTDVRGYYFRDFGITAYNGYDDSGATARPGRHAINFDVSGSTAAIYESVVERVYFTDLGGQGVFVNANASPGGIYAFGYSIIRDSTIYNGLNLQGTVDSLLIQGNKLRGKNPAVYVNQGVGSTEAVIDNNNITAGGGIIITHAIQFAITHNIIEMRYANTTGSDGAVISIHGPAVIAGTIERNQINTVGSSPALDGIFLQSCDAVEVGSNTYQLDSSKAMVRLHGTDVTNVQLSLRQTSTSGGTPPTRFVLNGATPVYEMVTVEGLYVSPLPGLLSIQGAKFGAGTHGHSDYYAGSATPGFGSVAAQSTADYTVSRSGVNANFNCKAAPQGDPGAGLTWDSTRCGTNTVVIRIANITGSPITPANVGWTWYAELANQ